MWKELLSNTKIVTNVKRSIQDKKLYVIYMYLYLYFILAFAMIKLTRSLRTPINQLLGHRRQKSEKVVVVVGGGAAGYFSAIECAKEVEDMNICAKVNHRFSCQ